MKTLDLLKAGQSPWLDFIHRGFTRSGELKKMVEKEGLRGMTSNPTIFEKSISQGHEYDQDIKTLAKEGASAHEIYEQLAITDVREAAATLENVYRESQGEDGYVSLEVSPRLAYDLEQTVAEAKRLFARVGAPNVLIKVPSTPQGVEATRQLTASGVNINVTLIFSADHYAQTARAYADGIKELAARGKDPSKVASVASIFVSRIDTAVDRRLDELARPAGREDKRGLERLKGKAAVANARIIYGSYRELFSSPGFPSQGARPQRLVWGSTSTKNPAYKDLKYVDGIIGPGTVNTMPLETFRAFQDHGIVRKTATQGHREAGEVLQRLEEANIDLREVCATLQKDGVAAFAASMDSLLATLEARRKEALALQPKGQAP